MATKLSRKYDALTRYLNSVISNEEMSPKTRMQAAETLNAIYSRHEHYAERAFARKERAEVRALNAQGQGGTIPLQESIPETDGVEETEDQQVQEVFARLLSRGKNALAD